MTTQLNRAQTEQVAMVTPSPPAFVSSSHAEPTPPPRPVVPQAAPEANHLEALKAVSAQIDSYLRSVGRTLDFTVDEKSGHPIITVRDSSGDVIRQIPNEEALRLARSLGVKPSALIDLLA